MPEPPRGSVGAPTELADAQEAPGCVVGVYKVVFGAPVLAVLLVKEIVTFPFEVLIYLYSRLMGENDA